MSTIFKNIERKILSSLRQRYKSHFGIGYGLLKSNSLVNMKIDEYNELLSNSIIHETPFMVSRFGSAEINWYLNYKSSVSGTLNRYSNYIKCHVDKIDPSDNLADPIYVKPGDIESTKYYSNCIENAILEIDVLGSWLRQEQSPLIIYKKGIKFTQLHHLEPFYYNKPWTNSLAGKKVLVIHPMKDSIINQYSRKEKVFPSGNILPDFELQVLKAIWFDDTRFASWAEILDYYYEEVEKLNFDVAILGCSSWGMPLAAKIKSMGKVAIHLGGATQLLFGILGDRWLNPQSKFFKLNQEIDIINKYWIKPSQNEKPLNANLIENGQNPYW